jgi:hypothetical protein
VKLYIVEEGKLVPYRRLGECKKCGACCRKKITFQWAILKAGKEGKGSEDDWHNWENFSVIYARGIYWYILVDSIEDPKLDDERNPCCSLEGNLCSIHDDQFQIPPLCPLWPVHPKDLLQGCGYSFEKLKGGEASE